jgi:hypothetical protein
MQTPGAADPARYRELVRNRAESLAATRTSSTLISGTLARPQFDAAAAPLPLHYDIRRGVPTGRARFFSPDCAHSVALSATARAPTG